MGAGGGQTYCGGSQAGGGGLVPRRWGAESRGCPGRGLSACEPTASAPASCLPTVAPPQDPWPLLVLSVVMKQTLLGALNPLPGRELSPAFSPASPSPTGRFQTPLPLQSPPQGRLPPPPPKGLTSEPRAASIRLWAPEADRPLTDPGSCPSRAPLHSPC